MRLLISDVEADSRESNALTWCTAAGRRLRLQDLNSETVTLDRASGDWWLGQQTNPGDAPGPAHTGALLIVGHAVNSEDDEKYNAWMNGDHVPHLRGVPGVISARRFQADEGEPRYLNIYHLESPDVMSSAAWKAGPTPNPVQSKVERVMLELCTPEGR